MTLMIGFVAGIAAVFAALLGLSKIAMIGEGRTVQPRVDRWTDPKARLSWVDRYF